MYGDSMFPEIAADKFLIANILANRIQPDELADVRDYFHIKVDDIIKFGDREMALEYVDLFEKVSGMFDKDMMYDQESGDVYKGIFYSLAQFLSLHFHIEDLPGEISRDKNASRINALMERLKVQQDNAIDEIKERL